MPKHLFKLLGFILALNTFFVANVANADQATADRDWTQEDPEAFKKRMQWWNEARFGLFIHWGLYSVPAGVWQGKQVPHYAEWIQANDDIPGEDYAKLAPDFNPTDLDAEAWVLAAKQAGMKYIVITTKHHDGFCIWPSAHTQWDIDDATPFKRDPLAELSAACKKHGIRFGTYYSTIDWHHPTMTVVRAKKGKTPKPAYRSPKMLDKPAYVAYMKAQIKELIERYDTDIMWFDGDWASWWTLEDGDDLYNYIRTLKPSIIINNRVSRRAEFTRDFGTPENFTPGKALGYDWEACWTMNHSWGYKLHDHSWKSDSELIRKLIDINSKGGNLLLNIGPKPDGTIPRKSLDGLMAMGQWMKANGDAIYGTHFSGLSAPPWGRITAKGDKTLFLHVFDHPKKGEIGLGEVVAESLQAKLLDGGHPLKATLNQGVWKIHLPDKDQSKHVTVIQLDFPKGYQVRKRIADFELKSGDLFLNPTDGKILGKGPLRLENGKQNFGYWHNHTQSIRWDFEMVIPGEYEAILVYSLPKSSQGPTAKLSSKHGDISTKLEATGKGWDQYKTKSLGVINFPNIDRESVTLSARFTNKPQRPLFNTKGLILRPVK